MTTAMAKKAPTSPNCVSASALASTSTSSPLGPTVEKMVLRTRATLRTRREHMKLDSDDEEPISVKRLKAKPLKKITNKPKKPPTAFFYFMENFRKEYKEQNPDVKSMRDVGKACGEKWKTMTYEEKVQYYDIATEKRVEFDRAMTEYDKPKEGCEDEETEVDSEFEE